MRPADLLIAGQDIDHHCVDVTEVSPLVTNNQPRVVVGKMAEGARFVNTASIFIRVSRQDTAFEPSRKDVFGVTAEI